MNPDCSYCGFKDDLPHTCFGEKERAVIDERTSWYHAEWQRAQDNEAKISELEGEVARLKTMSVTELAAEHPNLMEYIKQLEALTPNNVEKI